MAAETRTERTFPRVFVLRDHELLLLLHYAVAVVWRQPAYVGTLKTNHNIIISCKKPRFGCSTVDPGDRPSVARAPHNNNNNNILTGYYQCEGAHTRADDYRGGSI